MVAGIEWSNDLGRPIDEAYIGMIIIKHSEIKIVHYISIDAKKSSRVTSLNIDTKWVIC